MSRQELYQYIADNYPATIPPTTDAHLEVIGKQWECINKIDRGEITSGVEIDAELS